MKFSNPCVIADNAVMIRLFEQVVELSSIIRAKTIASDPTHLVDTLGSRGTLFGDMHDEMLSVGVPGEIAVFSLWKMIQYLTVGENISLNDLASYTEDFLERAESGTSVPDTTEEQELNDRFFDFNIITKRLAGDRYLSVWGSNDV